MENHRQQRILSQAFALGFDAAGFTVPALSPDVQAGLHEFLAHDHHGDMQWLKDKADKRADPGVLWPQARSILVVGHNYAPAFDPMEKLLHKSTGVISAYALGEDYHDVMKKRLRRLARWIADSYSCEARLFVDTAPVMEKALAAQAGLGWQGKHTCLVSRDFGSWLFLGCVFLSCDMSEANVHRTAPPDPDPAQPLRGSRDSHCGSCTRCLDVCPTQAFTAPGKLDARRCIAYLTIEHKGQIPLEFRKAIGNRIYGCDDCLAVCPWNKFAEASKEMAYHPRQALTAPLLRDLAGLDDAAFRRLFAKSPVKRLGRDRFVRNVLVAIGNSGDTSLAATATALQQDASPLVAEMADWAVKELRV